ncbi:MAG: TAT-variant-translocated molybdopterin oxidoreductase [Flavobacteriaceae bacterium]|nr:TAT-variant-translocated molybdopterin oxidoreductase [Flavobacteriaceae bacterium]
MSSTKKYWKNYEETGIAEEQLQAASSNEFVQPLPVEEFLSDSKTLETSKTSRRDFLKYLGFSTAAATVAACEGPIVKSVPYVVQPDRIVPGVANYYATTIADGYDFRSVLVKTREARPIKIENNKEAKVLGGANARVQASVLSLYDTYRAQTPSYLGSSITWEELDADIIEALEGVEDKKTVLLTQSFASPSTKAIIEEFGDIYYNVEHVVYDAISEEASVKAFDQKYAKKGMADYDLSKAMTIVSVGADFLGDWQGGGYEAGYAKNRIPQNGKMSKHIQFEANMSLSGAAADHRFPATPTQQKHILAAIYTGLNGAVNYGALDDALKAKVDVAIKQLKAAGSDAVVLTGIDDVDAQLVALEINEKLNSKAFDTKAPRLFREGNTKAVNQLIQDMNNGEVGVLIIAGVNPVYSLADSAAFKSGLEKVDVSVACSLRPDETASLCDYIAPIHHYLESWGDTELKAGHYSLTQPTIKSLFNTRQFQDSLLVWLEEDTTYYDYLKSYWEDNMPNASWDKTLHDGVYVSESSVFEDVKEMFEDENTTQGFNAAASVSALFNAKSNAAFELCLYPKVAMGAGTQANNPWLQELPDPLTRVTWDNYVTISAHDAKDLGVYLDRSSFFVERRNNANGGLNGKYITIGLESGEELTAPVIVQPGQAKGTIGLAFGYGQSEAMQKEMQVGVNAYQLYKDFKATQAVSLTEAGGDLHEFACIQLHNTLMGRGDIVKETTLEIFNTKDYYEWNPVPEVSLNHIPTPVNDPSVDIWESFDRSIGHHFNLSIDLNACTGCGACVIACHAENNVPVVGKDEVRKSRDMHWLRIDRYYSSEDTFTKDLEKKEGLSGLFGENGSLGGFSEMEDPSENPQVVFQPIMCQHCNHAPCETVCPVAATSHSKQGQNHMAYNRCVGTRYCANNCPYKVRRFNWFLYSQNDEFDFHMNNDLGRMVINPDVTVRSRGVMEKCSMCIQMTQKTILDAKREGRAIEDGEFATACSNACNTGALVFGDINDETSEVRKAKYDQRAYYLLEHVGTKPNVVYQVKVRNTEV